MLFPGSRMSFPNSRRLTWPYNRLVGKVNYRQSVQVTSQLITLRCFRRATRLWTSTDDGNLPSIAFSSAPTISLAASESLPSSRLNFCWAQVFQVRCDRPNKPERISHFTVAVAPELLPYWHCDRAACLETLRPSSIRIRQIQGQPHRPLVRSNRFPPELGKHIVQHHDGIPDAHAGIQQAAVW